MQTHSPGVPVSGATADLSTASPMSPFRRLKRAASSHFRLRRTVPLALLAFGLLSLYLTANCWTGFSHLFSHRRDIVSELGQRSASHRATCLFFSSSDSNSNADHPLPKHRSSLLVRPLKNADESLSVRELTVEKIESLIKSADKSAETSPASCTDRPFWRRHRNESQASRVARLEKVCAHYQFSGRIFTYHSATSNRQRGSTEASPLPRYCSTRTCPLLVAERQKVLACFVQKVASTSLKQIFLRMAGGQGSERDKTAASSSQAISNLTAFHQTANDALYRISPINTRHTKEATYAKALFVRHPFVRLVSAFKDKAERGPVAEPFFYAQYFNPVLDVIYGVGGWNESTRLTFRQFVEQLLLPTDPYLDDEHWSPVWSRCEPCFLHYTFIGKLESSQTDFRHFKEEHHLGARLLNETFWENSNAHFGSSDSAPPAQAEDAQCEREHRKYSETVRYLAQLPPQSIRQLYQRYYLDFELFGYTFQELFN